MFKFILAKQKLMRVQSLSLWGAQRAKLLKLNTKLYLQPASAYAINAYRGRKPMQYSGEHERINAATALGVRPFCRCCGGGEHRKGYTHTKAKSRADNEWEHEREKKRRARGFDRASARPDKYGAWE
jgi:hypothetical protein